MSGDLASFIAQQRAQGKTDDQIEQGLVSTGWDKTAVVAALSGAAIADQNSVKAASHVNASQVFSAIGILLVVVAYAAFLFSSWADLSATIKIVIAAIPSFLLFVISGAVSRQASLIHVRDATAAAALITLPPAIGVLLFQSELYQVTDGLLFLLSTIIALPIYLLFDIWLKRSSLAPLTILNVLASALFFVLYSSPEAWVGATIFLLFAFITTLLAILFQQRKDQQHARTYQITSAILTIGVVPATISAYLSLLFPDPSYYYPAALETSLIAGIVLLVVSQWRGKIFQPVDGTEWSLQRLLQLVAMLLLFGGVASSSWDAGSQQLVVGLIIGVLVIVYALLVGVNLLFISGILGTGLVLLVYLLQYLGGGLETLLAIVLVGFASIGLGIFLGRSRFARSSLYSAALAGRLGVISDEAAEQIHHVHPNEQHTRWWLVILLILATPMLVGFIFSIIMSTRYRDVPTVSEPPAYYYPTITPTP